MGSAATPPKGWKIRQIPWLAPGTSVAFTGQDLTVGTTIDTTMTVGATLGGGGQAAVFSVDLPDPLPGVWSHDDVVLRVSYQDDEYGRDPRRTSIYRHLARLRGADPGSDPLEGLLRLHAVGHLPPPQYLPGQELWAQVLDRGGIGLQQWIGGNHPAGLGHEGGVAVMLPIMHALALCHREGIVHRDVKPGNVFVNARCPIPAPAALAGPRAAALFAARLPFLRLGDLGSMTYLSADAMARLEAGSAPEAGLEDVEAAADDAMTHTFTTNIQSGPFTPPEVWSSAAQSEAHPAGDVWQLAVTLHYACTGELPFQGWRSAQWRSERSKYVQATQSGEPNAESFDRLPERLQYLLRWSLAADPLDRPDLASLTDELTRLPGVTTAARSAAGPPAEARTPAQMDRSHPPPRGDLGPVPTTAQRDPADSPSERSEPVEPPDADAVTVPSGISVVPEGHRVESPAEDVGGSSPVTTPWAGAAPTQRGVPRRPRSVAAVAAVMVMLLVAGLAYLRHRTPTVPDEAAQQHRAATPSVSATPLGDSGSVQWNVRGSTLGQVLPQLFTGTPLSHRRNLGVLKEHEFRFCSQCSSAGVRLRVEVTPPSGPTLTANAAPQKQPIGPYLVVMTSRDQSFPPNPYAVEPLRTYPITGRYASAKYQRVVLVPMNRIGEGSASPKWQTAVSGSRRSQRLTFDIPGQVAYITVLWFNQDGVVGFNHFDRKNRRPSITYP